MRWAVRKLLLTAAGYQQVFFWCVEGSYAAALEVARQVFALEAGEVYAISIQPMQSLQGMQNTHSKEYH